MGKRLLILGAGTGASNNLIHSLGAGDPSLEIVGCHDDRFFLKKSLADRKYLTPPSKSPRWGRVLRHIVKAEKIDLIIPTSDADVRALSRAPGTLQHHVFLPAQPVIEQCQDKYRLTAFLRARRLPAPVTYPVTDLRCLDGVFRRFPHGSPVWCRVRIGTGSMGAIPLRTPEQARSWIKYWQEMRDVPAASFTLSEYLPGRDLGCQSLWKDGRLALIKTYERLSYLGTGNQPSPISSVAALAKTVVEPRVAEICAEAILALDPTASGVFSIDLREDARGNPCITEINAGRFSSATPIFDLTGKHNMAVTYVRLALEERVDIGDPYDFVEDYYMLRDVDAPAHIFHADEFFEEIKDVRR